MCGYALRYNELKARLQGKNVTVVGLGKSNLPLIRFLLDLGCHVTARDRKDETSLGRIQDNYLKEDVRFCLGKNYLTNLHEEILFLTPGIPKDLPEIREAVQRGSVIDSEMGLFLHLCQGKTIGITGSVGKTTTTSIAGEIFKESGNITYVGGNIGTPLLEKAAEIGPDAFVILELSSFQLEMLKVSTGISAVLNLFPNHLDQHRSMDEYVQAKKNIFRFQDENGILILNGDSELTLSMRNEAKGKTLVFSVKGSLNEPNCIYLEDGKIVLALDGLKEEICHLDDIVLPGKHNVGNFMVAAGIARLCGIEKYYIQKVAGSFQGIEHRISFVRELKGVRYFNDSKATTPESTMSAIRAFEEPITLIAGGYDKHVSFKELAKEIVDNIKLLILIGVTADQIEREVRAAASLSDKMPDIRRCASLQEAVAISQETEAGGLVLLSPACASYDMFNNFEERGQVFSQLVHDLT